MLAVVVAAGLVFVNNSGFAADGGDITIQGTVATVNEIVVTSETDYNLLNLTLGEAWKLVATVNEKNNDPDGYTVTLASLNAYGAQARLKSTETTPIYVNYSMKYGTAGTGADADVSLTAGSATVTSTSAATGSSGVDQKLTVTIAANSWPDAGVYSDTLTLTIASK